MTSREQFELAALAAQAWEIRHGHAAYLTDACEAIAVWHERRHLRRLEREQEETAHVLTLMREINEAAA